jgi:hypothetical protein
MEIPAPPGQCRGRQGRGQCKKPAVEGRDGYCRFHGGKDPAHTVSPAVHARQPVVPRSQKILELLDQEIDRLHRFVDEQLAQLETLKKAKRILAKE